MKFQWLIGLKSIKNKRKENDMRKFSEADVEKFINYQVTYIYIIE